MAAGVVKALQCAALIANQQELLVADFEGAERPRRRDLAGAADVDPVTVPDPLQFPLIVARLEI